MRIKITLFFAVFAVSSTLFSQSYYSFSLLRKILVPLNATVNQQSHSDSLIPQNHSSHTTLLYGYFQNTRLEKHLGGADTALQALVFLPSHSVDTFVPQKHYKALPFCLVNMPFSDSFWTANVLSPQYPLAVALINNDSNAFLELKNWLVATPQFHVMSLPDSAQRLHQIPIKLSEFELPLPCTHTEFYIQYLQNQTFNLAFDQLKFADVDSVKLLKMLLEFSNHCQKYHQKCDLNVHIHFDNRNINMAEISALMAEISDLGYSIKTSFTD